MLQEVCVSLSSCYWRREEDVGPESNHQTHAEDNIDDDNKTQFLRISCSRREKQQEVEAKCLKIKR